MYRVNLPFVNIRNVISTRSTRESRLEGVHTRGNLRWLVQHLSNISADCGSNKGLLCAYNIAKHCKNMSETYQLPCQHSNMILEPCPQSVLICLPKIFLHSASRRSTIWGQFKIQSNYHTLNITLQQPQQSQRRIKYTLKTPGPLLLTTVQCIDQHRRYTTLQDLRELQYITMS